MRTVQENVWNIQKKIKKFSLKSQKLTTKSFSEDENWLEPSPHFMAVFGHFWPFLDCKNGRKKAKNTKIKNLVLAIVEGHGMKVCANFQPQKVIWC